MSSRLEELWEMMTPWIVRMVQHGCISVFWLLSMWQIVGEREVLHLATWLLSDRLGCLMTCKWVCKKKSLATRFVYLDSAWPLEGLDATAETGSVPNAGRRLPCYQSFTRFSIPPIYGHPFDHHSKTKWGSNPWIQRGLRCNIRSCPH